MLAEDTFLNLILVDETYIVESSSHSYRVGEKHEGTIVIPHAKSLELQFDDRCSTEVSDGLAFYSSETDESAPITTYQGAFGAQNLIIEGNTLRFKFPVESEFNWRLDRNRKVMQYNTITVQEKAMPYNSSTSQISISSCEIKLL